MKKKLLALVCALVMIFSLASCGLSTPDTVGKVGDFEVSSGLYLLAQFSAYQQAAQLVGTDQDTTDVKAFLKKTITTDADSGETAVVQDYVADKTLETLRTFAAIDARFAELGGELTAEQTQVADNYAQQLMDQYGSTYTANGIGLETLKAFERIQLKHTLLLTLVYGPDGESPVDDSDLTEHLDSQMYELAYVNIPLYNTSTFVSASDDQKAQMLQLAQAAAASCSETQDGSVSEQVSALHSAASYKKSVYRAENPVRRNGDHVGVDEPVERGYPSELDFIEHFELFAIRKRKFELLYLRASRHSFF